MSKKVSIRLHTDDESISRLTEVMQCCVAAGGERAVCKQTGKDMVVTCQIADRDDVGLINELCGCSALIDKNCILIQ